MRKVLLSVLAIAAMATSANAWWINNADIKWVKPKADGFVYVNTNNGADFEYKIGGDSDAKKAIMAAALTALSTGRKVNVEIVGGAINTFIINSN